MPKSNARSSNLQPCAEHSKRIVGFLLTMILTLPRTQAPLLPATGCWPVSSLAFLQPPLWRVRADVEHDETLPGRSGATSARVATPEWMAVGAAAWVAMWTWKTPLKARPLPLKPLQEGQPQRRFGPATQRPRGAGQGVYRPERCPARHRRQTAANWRRRQHRARAGAGAGAGASLHISHACSILRHPTLTGVTS